MSLSASDELSDRADMWTYLHVKQPDLTFVVQTLMSSRKAVGQDPAIVSYDFHRGYYHRTSDRFTYSVLVVRKMK